MAVHWTASTVPLLKMLNFFSVYAFGEYLQKPWLPLTVGVGLPIPLPEKVKDGQNKSRAE
jgi:hypothetical protein